MSQRPSQEWEAGPPARKGASSDQDGGGGNGSRTSGDIREALAVWQQSLQSVKQSIDEATRAVGALRAALVDMAPLWRSLGQLEQALKEIQWEEPTAIASPLEAAEAPTVEAADSQVAAPEAEPEEATAPSVEASVPEAEAIAQEAEAVAQGPVEEPEVVGAVEGSVGEPENVAAAEEPAAEVEAATQDVEATVEEQEPAPAAAFSGPRRPLPAEGLEREPPAAHAYTITVEDPGAEAPLVPLYRALGRVGRIRDMDLVSYTNGVAVISLQSDDEIAADDLRVAISESVERNCRIVNHESNVFLVRMEPR